MTCEKILEPTLSKDSRRRWRTLGARLDPYHVGAQRDTLAV